MGEKEKTDRRTWLKIAGGTVGGLAIGGVGGYFSGRVLTPPETVPALKGEIPIGVIHASTLELQPAQPAVDMAIEDINNWCKETGIPVSFVALAENAEESATKMVERTETLIGRGVKFFVAPSWSSMCKAAMKTITDAKVVFLSYGSSSPALAVPDDYLFRLVPDDTKQASCIRRMVVDLGIKAVIVVYTKEAFGEGIWKECEKRWTESGIEIIDSIGVDPEKKEFIGEFGTVDAKYKEALGKYAKDTVAIYLLGVYDPVVAMTVSIGKYPDLLSARVFDSDAAPGPGFIEYSPKICTQIRFTAYAPAGPESPKRAEFREGFTKRTGFDPYSTSYQCYDCTWVGALSILAAGKYDGPAIKAVLPKIAESYFGVGGWRALNEAGDQKYAYFEIFQVVEEGGTTKWKSIGFYDGPADAITWYK